MNLSATTYLKKGSQFVEVTPIYLKNYDFSQPIEQEDNGWVTKYRDVLVKKFPEIGGVSFFTTLEQPKQRYITQTINNLPAGFYKIEFIRMSQDITRNISDISASDLIIESLTKQTTWYNFRINDTLVIDQNTSRQITDIYYFDEHPSNKHNLIVPGKIRKTDNDFQFMLSGETKFCQNLQFSDSISEWTKNYGAQYLVSNELFLPEETNKLDISFGMAIPKTLDGITRCNYIGGIRLYYSILPSSELNSSN